MFFRTPNNRYQIANSDFRKNAPLQDRLKTEEILLVERIVQLFENSNEKKQELEKLVKNLMKINSEKRKNLNKEEKEILRKKWFLSLTQPDLDLKEILLLIANGVDINERCGARAYEDFTVGFFIAMRNDYKLLELFSLLDENIYLLKTRNNYTPLYVAIYNDLEDAIRFLTNHYIERNPSLLLEKNEFGDNLLHIIATKTDPEVGYVFIDEIIKSNKTDILFKLYTEENYYDKKPIQLAVIVNSVPMQEFFIRLYYFLSNYIETNSRRN